MAVGFLVLCALMGVVPRWHQIPANALMWDDYVHQIEWHLEQGRLTLYFYHGVMTAVFGSAYLTTPWARAFLCLWSSLAAWLLGCIARNFGIRAHALLVLPALLLWHPLANDYLLWNSLDGYAFGLVLILAGCLQLQRANVLCFRSLAGGVALLLGVNAYQPFAGLLLFAFLANELMSTSTLVSKGALRRILLLGALIGSAVSATAAMKYAMPAGMISISERGLASYSELTSSPFWILRTKEFFNFTGIFFQPFLSYHWGTQAAWTWWYRLDAVFVILSAVGLFVRAQRLGTSRAAALLPFIGPFVVLAPLLPLGYFPPAWRIGYLLWFVKVFCALPLLQVVCDPVARSGQTTTMIAWLRRGSWVPLAITAAFGTVALPVVTLDANNRVFAYRQDRASLGEIVDYWERQGVPRSQVCVSVAGPSQECKLEPRDPTGRRSIIAGWRRVNASSYTTLGYPTCTHALLDQASLSLDLNGIVEGRGFARHVQAECPVFEDEPIFRVSAGTEPGSAHLFASTLPTVLDLRAIAAVQTAGRHCR